MPASNTGFEFDYDFVVRVYADLMDTQHVFVAISGVKILAVLLMLLVWYNKFMTSIDKSGGEPKPPLTITDIYQGILILTLVGSYDVILDFLDSMLGAIEGEYLVSAVKSKAAWESNEITDTDAQMSAMDYLKAMGSVVVDTLTDPAWYILKILESFCYILDKIMYGIVISERFFFLGVLRVLGGFCLACFMVEKLQSWFWNWLKLYVALYLVIIPIFLINRFCNAIYDSCYNQLNDGGLDRTSAIMIIVLVYVVVLKTKLFAQSQSILFKIFA